MPLVKDGHVIEDRFARILDDAPVPESGAVIVPAARYLADSAELALRSAPTGVLWPNNRNVAELASHLDSLALVALVFPNFRDGRAYSQARLLRERYGFRGELRATGRSAARPIPVSRARRLRCLRGEEGCRRRGVRRGRRALQRVLSADRGRPSVCPEGADWRSQQACAIRNRMRRCADVAS